LASASLTSACLASICFAASFCGLPKRSGLPRPCGSCEDTPSGMYWISLPAFKNRSMSSAKASRLTAGVVSICNFFFTFFCLVGLPKFFCVAFFLLCNFTLTFLVRIIRFFQDFPCLYGMLPVFVRLLISQSRRYRLGIVHDWALRFSTKYGNGVYARKIGQHARPRV